MDAPVTKMEEPIIRSWYLGMISLLRKIKNVKEQTSSATCSNSLYDEARIEAAQFRLAHLGHEFETRLSEHSSQSLAPLLEYMCAKLPIELRQKVYEELVDTGEPRVFPEHGWESSSSALCWGSDSGPRRACIFPDDFAFDERLMGTEVCCEIMEFYLRRTPIYFHAYPCGPNLAEFLSVQLATGKRIASLIRHIRVLLRWDMVENNFLNTVPSSDSEHEKTAYSSCQFDLEALIWLNYNDYEIILDMCILHNTGCGSSEHPLDTCRMRHNLIEVMKPAAYYAKHHGARVTLRLENHRTSVGEDITWRLEVDAALWEKWPYPRYLPQANAHTWKAIEKWNSTQESSRNMESRVPNVTWKHALSKGHFLACQCEDCSKWQTCDCGKNCPRKVPESVSSEYTVNDDTARFTCDFDFWHIERRRQRRYRRIAGRVERIRSSALSGPCF